MIPAIQQRNFDTLSSELGGWNRSEVWDILRTLIAEQLAGPLERVQRRRAGLAKGQLGMS